MNTPDLYGAAQRARSLLNFVCAPPPGMGFLSGEAFDAALKVVRDDLDRALAAWRSPELIVAAKQVLRSVDQHIRALAVAGKPVPVLAGVADLHDAVGRLEGGAS